MGLLSLRMPVPFYVPCYFAYGSFDFTNEVIFVCGRMLCRYRTFDSTDLFFLDFFIYPLHVVFFFLYFY